MVGLCYPAGLENTFVVLKSYVTKNTKTILCSRAVPGSWKCLHRPVTITGNGLAAGCQLFSVKSTAIFAVYF